MRQVKRRPPLKPWFDLPSKVLDAGYSIAFGHWASLQGKGTPSQVYALDTGCCWGGELTMLRWDDRQYFTQPAHRSDLSDSVHQQAAS
jgi:bis(5'-nucleosyl)-tetraphosphatase (symmetrical)